MENIGILHPGEMGVSLAAAARQAGHAVYWSSHGRSTRTRLRAEEHSLADAGSLEVLCGNCSVLISVCPPHAAEQVAREVIERSFHGLYLDANAISPARAARISDMMQAAGIEFVDGGIIGGPAWQPGETWLYLSGPQAERIAACFEGGPLGTQVIGEAIGRASALKMCYAAWSKGSTALLCAALGAAEALGVRNGLYGQWERDQKSFPAQAERHLVRVTPKAWRFEGEMYEIADTLRDAGLPGGFHEAAAELYQRLARFKDAGELPDLASALAALLKPNGAP